MIYFIEAVDLNRVKIGTTRQLSKRLAALQHASGVELRIGRTYGGGPIAEKKLHELFAPWRMQGEWFALDQVEAMIATVGEEHLEDLVESASEEDTEESKSDESIVSINLRLKPHEMVEIHQLSDIISKNINGIRVPRPNLIRNLLRLGHLKWREHFSERQAERVLDMIGANFV